MTPDCLIMAEARLHLPCEASNSLPPISGPASQDTPNSGTDLLRNSAFLPTNETVMQSLTVNASVTDLADGHIGMFPEAQPSTSRINYANEEQQRHTTTRLPESSGKQTSGFDYAAVQQQLLMQNQMILQMMQRIPTATMNSVPQNRPSATVSVAPSNETADFSSLLDNSPSKETRNADIHNDLECQDDGFDDQHSSISGHNTVHEISDADDDQPDETVDLSETLKDMEHFYSEGTKCAASVSKRLSDAVNTGMRVNLDKTKRKELLNKYFRPENCAKVVVPKVNKSIWHMLPRHIKDKDSQFQMTQMHLCKAIYPLIQLTNMLIQDGYSFTADKVKEALTLSNDVFSILQVAFSDITFRRKAALRPTLQPEYQSLCSMETPATDWLFGDNLEEQIKDITDAQRIRKKLTSGRQRPRPYSAPRPVQGSYTSTYRTSSGSRPGVGEFQQNFSRNHRQNQNSGQRFNVGDKSTKGPFFRDEPKTRKESEVVGLDLTATLNQDLDRTCTAEGGGGGNRPCASATSMDNANVVPEIASDDCRHAITTSNTIINCTPGKQPTKNSSHKEPQTDCMQIIREALQNQGISSEATTTILAAWRTSTREQYWVHIRRWLRFCEQQTVNSFQPSITHLLQFLQILFDERLSYSSINTAKSAICSFLSIVNDKSNIVNHPLIRRFMKGIFNQRPALPRYFATWNVSVVLSFLETLVPVHAISFRYLSYKLLMLLALLTGQRCQTFHLIDVRNIICTDDMITISIGDLLKHSKPGTHLEPIQLKAFTLDPRLCIVQTIREYLKRTSTLRLASKSTQLFLSIVSPHKPVCKQTLSQWIRKVLQLSGIDTTIFKAHSTRSASTSAAHAANVPIVNILKTAGWASGCTFQIFYQRQLHASKNQQDDSAFDQVLLKQHVSSENI